MGAPIGKPFDKSKVIMMDKGMFTSNMSLQSSCQTKNNQHSLSCIKSKIKSASRDKLSSFFMDKMMTSMDITKIYSEVPVETLPTESLPMSNISEKTVSIRKLLPNCQKIQIEQLGLHKVQTDEDVPCYSGVIYLPECDLVLFHYLTLYRLKLDCISQHDFEKWCLTVGHTNTVCKYYHLLKVFLNLKDNHFKEAFIINRILSKRSVHLRISDRFGFEDKPLRALIVIGQRRQVVKGVIDLYCFNIQGKVPFIIKSFDDYKKLMRSSNKDKEIQLKLENVFIDTRKNIPVVSQTKRQIKSPSCPLVANESIPCSYADSKVNSVHFLKSEKADFFQKNQSQSDLIYQPFSNYMRLQRHNTDMTNVCYNNSPILFNGATYNLVSIIADQTYAYILCKNTLFNLKSCNELEYKSLMFDESSSPLFQSNSFSRFKTLKRIMKTEIFETFAQKCYGVSLNQVPCGQFYVVQCIIEGRISERESLVNKILIRHLVCGKVISKEYNLEVHGCGDINFVIHLHGNERHIRKCCEDLKNEGLAHSFKLIHPRTGNLLQEKIRMKNQFV